MVELRTTIVGLSRKLLQVTTPWIDESPKNNKDLVTHNKKEVLQHRYNDKSRQTDTRTRS